MQITVKLIVTAEPGEDLVIEHIREFEQYSINSLHKAIMEAHMINDAYSETLGAAISDKKRLEVIIATLLHIDKRLLTFFLMTIMSGGILYADYQEGSQLYVTIATVI